jgi:hypothetical protein
VVESKIVNPWRPFYDAVQRVLRELDQAHGPLYFGGLVQLEGQSSGKWTLLVGSDHLARDRYRGVGIVVDLLAEKLSRAHGNLIQSVAVLRRDDPFYGAVSATIGQGLGPVTEVVNCRFGDVDVGHLVLFLAQRAAHRRTAGARAAKARPGETRQKCCRSRK